MSYRLVVEQKSKSKLALMPRPIHYSSQSYTGQEYTASNIYLESCRNIPASTPSNQHMSGPHIVLLKDEHETTFIKSALTIWNLISRWNWRCCTLTLGCSLDLAEPTRGTGREASPPYSSALTWKISLVKVRKRIRSLTLWWRLSNNACE